MYSIYAIKDLIQKNLAEFSFEDDQESEKSRLAYFPLGFEKQAIAIKIHYEDRWCVPNSVNFFIQVVDEISGISYDLHSTGRQANHGFRVKNEWIDEDISDTCKHFRIIAHGFPCFTYTDQYNDYNDRFPFEYPITLLARTKSKEEFVGIMNKFLSYCILGSVNADLNMAFRLANEISKSKGYGDLFIDRVMQLRRSLKAAKELSR